MSARDAGRTGFDGRAPRVPAPWHGPYRQLLAEDEPAVVISCIVGRELYDISMPVVVLKPEIFATLATGVRIEIAES